MTQKVYTWQEVSKHNQPDNLWVVINDTVYDVTKYANEHPGGPIVLINKAGKNASLAFEQASHSKNARENVLPIYAIGKIDQNSTMLEHQKEDESSGPNLVITVAIILAILAFIYYMSS